MTCDQCLTARHVRCRPPCDCNLCKSGYTVVRLRRRAAAPSRKRTWQPTGNPIGRPRKWVAWLTEARELRDQGASYPELGRRFGVHHTTVMYALNAEWREAKREKDKARYHNDRASVASGAAVRDRKDAAA